ncbi:MAG: hypothetical protein ABSF67_02840 [Roseiarcus sp.]
MKEEFPLVNRVTERGLPPRPVHAIACSQCPEEDFVSALNCRLPPHTVAARFQRAGWVVRDHGKHLCPACAKTRRAEVRQGGSAMLKATTTPALDDVARRAIPELYMELATTYDREAKAYRDGVTDASLAAKFSLPTAIVAERRERDFGPLVESEAARRKREAEAEMEKARAAEAVARTTALLKFDDMIIATQTAQAALKTALGASSRMASAAAALIAAQEGRAA